MKCIYLPIVFVALCLIVSTYSVPVREPNQIGKKLKQVAVTDNTGSVVSSNPAAGITDISDEDDDDDDDDDDGLEEVLVDDGDDDDEDDGDDEDDDEDTEDDEEDDEDDDEGEDGDYLERFFDDILGDDDDDDDADAIGEVAITNITSVINTPAPAAASAPIPQQLNPIEVVNASSSLNTVDTDDIQDEVVIAPEIQPNVEKTTKAPVYELVISQDEDGDGDEDDDFADGVIEARAINRLSKQTEESSSNDGDMLPSAILSKYNTIVDGVYDKLNRILKKMYDPINVQLTKQSKRSESKNLKRHKIRIDARKSGISSSNTKPKKRVNEAIGGTKPVTKSKTRARGTMYGLSTLKRKGNIHVTSENHEDTIKSDFVLGPLVLKVSKSFSRGTKRELRSASAMTSKLRGRIVLKVNDGTTILHTIKIQQPKNVKIEVPGKKLHKSREIEWRKNLNIAQIVADQLSTVSRTMLHL